MWVGATVFIESDDFSGFGFKLLKINHFILSSICERI